MKLHVTLPASREDIVALSPEERAALFAHLIGQMNRPHMEALFRLFAAAGSKRGA